MLAVLFLKEHSFLLIDEPTNHLDTEARRAVSRYLNRKKGFILVSHDRVFMDECIDHVLSLNKNTIEVVQGNFCLLYTSSLFCWAMPGLSQSWDETWELTPLLIFHSTQSGA